MRNWAFLYRTPQLATWVAAATILASAMLVASAAAPAPAAAATVLGSVQGGAGYEIVLVQANGKARKTTVSGSSGKFSIGAATLAGASLQLVGTDGSYYGPIVLKASTSKALVFIWGASNLNIGTVVLKQGYALARRVPLRRWQTLAQYAARAVNGKPIGAGKLGLVRTSQPMGLRGPGGDLDLDGIVNVFDIDDNGNRVIDNVDRRRRARPVAARHGGAVLHVLQLLAHGRGPVDVPARGLDQR